MSQSSRITTVRMNGETDGVGAATADSDQRVMGRVVGVKAYGSLLDAAGLLTINAVLYDHASSDEKLGEDIITDFDIGTPTGPVELQPVRALQDEDGAAIAAQFDGFIVDGKLRATIASGGDTKPFAVDVYVER